MAAANTVLPCDLHSCVRRSGVAFAGTVSSIFFEQLETTIVTHVDFTNITFVKGGPKNGRTRLTLDGGVVGNKRVFSRSQPQFEIGRRYIVLAYGDFGSRHNSYLPIVGLYQGFFQVVIDSAEKGATVFDWAMRPIVRVDGHRLVVAVPPGWKQDQDSVIDLLGPEGDPRTRLSEESFLAEIVRLEGEH